ncbi:FHA domain-containing protein [Oscillospiraceae bacterium]|nr:FHA domain-containing protein [Oscillospiraceae bacterium]
MDIRKGPYGKFAAMKLEDDTLLHEYAAEIIRDGIPGCFLPVYVNEYRNGRELSFDISDLIPLTRADLIKGTNQKRKAAADLFLSLTSSCNMLLDTSNIILSDKYAYWDPKEQRILLPYKPIVSKTPSVHTSGLKRQETESFLKSNFFSDILTLEEKDTLTFAMSEDNEDMIKNTCTRIRNTDIHKDKKSLSDTCKTLILSIISALCALFSVIKGDIPIALAFFLFSATIPFIINFAGHGRTRSEEEKEGSSLRRSIFFEDSGSGNDIDCLILTYYIDNERIRRAIYTDRATLGSDRFLSDIIIDDSSIEALHLEIIKSTDSYMVRDLSINDNVMLDGHRIEKDRPYEIRDGQRLLCGNIEFTISRGLR